jgi:hypothetical protein
MNSDEQFFKRADKQMLNQLWQGYVRLISTRTKFKKGSFYCPFFFCYKNLQ